MRILFILPSLDAGGTENYALRFINANRNIHEFTVISVNPNKGDLHTAFVAAGATIHYKAIGYVYPWKWYGLYRFMREREFHTVCTFNGNFGGVPLTVAKAAGIVKRVAFYRRSTPAFADTGFRKIYHRLVGRLVYLNATDILSNSRAALESFFLSSFPFDSRFEIIPNGVKLPARVSLSVSELRGKFGIPDEAFVIGHVGRFDPAKNHSMIFAVMREFVGSRRETCVVFCGKGTDSPEFKRGVKENGIAEHSICLGIQNDVWEVLRTFDVFFFPSLTEGQPNALIEAMLAGVPIVASDIKSIKEMIPASFHEWLSAPLDKESFVRLIMKVRFEKCAFDTLSLQKYARSFFNDEVRFKQFENRLIHNENTRKENSTPEVAL